MSESWRFALCRTSLFMRCAGLAVKKAMSNNNMGSSSDDFLKEEGIFEETQAQAVKEVVAWQRQNGRAAEDKPHAGGPAAGSEK